MSEHYQPLELRTHTSLWRIERKMYKLYDFTLPVPISTRQLGIVFGVGLPWIFILKVLHVPFAAPWHVLWIAPPCLLAWYANKPVAEGKRLGELISSTLRYWVQPRRFLRLRPASTKDERVWVLVQTWKPFRSEHDQT